MILTATTTQRLARGTGWTLIVVGIHILLFLVYLLKFTSLETDAAQASLLEDWRVDVGAIEIDGAPTILPGEIFDEPDGEAEEISVGNAYAVMWFERPGVGEIIHDGPLAIVEGVTLDRLKAGPGHYPKTSRPGADGNFAISGHRTTYSEPFYNLEQMREGDLVHVQDRSGKVWTYEFEKQIVVQPTDTWVVGRNPLRDGRPLMTLTTCHPRFSAAQRLIVFAHLVE